MLKQDIVNEVLIHGPLYVENKYTLNQLRDMYMEITGGNYRASGKKHDIAQDLYHCMYNQNRAWALIGSGTKPYRVITTETETMRNVLKQNSIPTIVSLCPDAIVDIAYAQLSPMGKDESKYAKVKELHRLICCETV